MAEKSGQDESATSQVMQDEESNDLLFIYNTLAKSRKEEGETIRPVSMDINPYSPDTGTVSKRPSDNRGSVFGAHQRAALAEPGTYTEVSVRTRRQHLEALRIQGQGRQDRNPEIKKDEDGEEPISGSQKSRQSHFQSGRKSCLHSRKNKNVLLQMEASIGPLELLYRSVRDHLKVKVWIRSAKHVRGFCTGYVVAFDRHWNLAMVDVDELYKPYISRQQEPSFCRKKTKKLKCRRTGSRRMEPEESTGHNLPQVDGSVDISSEEIPSDDSESGGNASSMEDGDSPEEDVNTDEDGEGEENEEGTAQESAISNHDSTSDTTDNDDEDDDDDTSDTTDNDEEEVDEDLELRYEQLKAELNALQQATNSPSKEPSSESPKEKTQKEEEGGDASDKPNVLDISCEEKNDTDKGAKEEFFEGQALKTEIEIGDQDPKDENLHETCPNVEPMEDLPSVDMDKPDTVGSCNEPKGVPAEIRGTQYNADDIGERLASLDIDLHPKASDNDLSKSPPGSDNSAAQSTDEDMSAEYSVNTENIEEPDASPTKNALSSKPEESGEKIVCKEKRTNIMDKPVDLREKLRAMRSRKRDERPERDVVPPPQRPRSQVSLPTKKTRSDAEEKDRRRKTRSEEKERGDRDRLTSGTGTYKEREERRHSPRESQRKEERSGSREKRSRSYHRADEEERSRRGDQKRHQSPRETRRDRSRVRDEERVRTHSSRERCSVQSKTGDPRNTDRYSHKKEARKRSHSRERRNTELRDKARPRIKTDRSGEELEDRDKSGTQASDKKLLNLKKEENVRCEQHSRQAERKREERTDKEKRTKPEEKRKWETQGNEDGERKSSYRESVSRLEQDIMNKTKTDHGRDRDPDQRRTDTENIVPGIKRISAFYKTLGKPVGDTGMYRRHVSQMLVRGDNVVMVAICQ